MDVHPGMIEVTFSHRRDFSTAARDLLRLIPRVKKRLNELAEETMLEVKRDLQAAILTKDRSSFIKRLRAISPGWVEEKKAKGQMPQQLAATGAYARAIIIKRGNEEIALTLIDGAYPGRKFKYSDLARFLEYGTKNMKPLPHWRKAAKHFRKEFIRKVRGEFDGVSISG